MRKNAGGNTHFWQIAWKETRIVRNFSVSPIPLSRVRDTRRILFRPRVEFPETLFFFSTPPTKGQFEN